MFLDGLFFRTREHAFQWGKFKEWNVQEIIRCQPTSRDAKREAKKYKKHVRPDWYTGFSIEWMERVVYEYFRQHEHQRQLLLGTGDEHLEERNTWGDMFWGTVDGKGRNELGKCLMRVRSRLRPADLP
jgi:ribA/ribD-fused uncharacterized protein